MLAVEDTLLVLSDELAERGVVVAERLQVLVDRQADGQHTVDDVDVAVLCLHRAANGEVVNAHTVAIGINPDGLAGTVVDAEAVDEFRGRDGGIADTVAGKERMAALR